MLINRTSSFLDDLNWSCLPAAKIKKQRKIKSSKPIVRDFLPSLFPADFSTEEHIQRLFNEDIIWSESHVRLLQIHIASDVRLILSRSNSSVDAMNECMMWIFYSDPKHDFGIHQCAARASQSVESFRQTYLCILSKTLRNLRKANAKPEKINYYRKLLMKANSLMDEYNVTLVGLERTLT
ncbi:hypothetical protein M3914_003114 [Vibrio metschnikovii]|nr:hypothetical protein [Vibrio metschnikovii]